MNKQTLLQMWDMMRQRHGIALRLVGGMPADRLDNRPIPDMRTPKELVVHLYEIVVKGMPESVVSGEMKVDDSLEHERQVAATLQTRDDVLRFMRDCWSAADRAVAAVTDAQLAAEVKTPWGMNFPGWMMFGINHDEFLHHRGQLYVFARALGVEPPMMWDFGNNEPEYRPKAQATA
jgi:hypothetical protein